MSEGEEAGNGGGDFLLILFIFVFCIYSGLRRYHTQVFEFL